VVSDAAESHGYVGTLRCQFEQEKRWAWGVADIPYVLMGLVRTAGTASWRRWYRCLRYIEEHLSWPLSPVIITFGGGATGVFNHAFAQTPIGKLLPSLDGYVLTASLTSMMVLIVVDTKLKPKAPLGDHPLVGLRYLIEWCLMPAVGIALSALPGLVSHTRLLLGNYLEYKVTKKLPPSAEPLPVLQMEQLPVRVVSEFP